MALGFWILDHHRSTRLGLDTKSHIHSLNLEMLADFVGFGLGRSKTGVGDPMDKGNWLVSSMESSKSFERLGSSSFKLGRDPPCSIAMANWALPKL